MNLLDLDHDSLLMVLSKLPWTDLPSVRLVNSRLRDIADEIPHECSFEVSVDLLKRCPLEDCQSMYQLMGRRGRLFLFASICEEELLSILPFLKRPEMVGINAVDLEDFDGIKKFPAIECLELTGVAAELDYLEKLFQWLNPSLTRLELSGDIGGGRPILSALLQLHNLQQLTTYAFAEDLTKFLLQNQNLEKLQIIFRNYEESGLNKNFQALGGLKNLKLLRLSLYGLPLDCAHLPTLSTLKELYIFSGNEEELFGCLSKLPGSDLETLRVNSGDEVSVTRILPHLVRFESLALLEIQGYNDFIIGDDDLQLFRQHWKNLEFIIFLRCKLTTILKILEASTKICRVTGLHIKDLSTDDLQTFRLGLEALLTSQNRIIRINGVLCDTKTRSVEDMLMLMNDSHLW